MKGQVGADGAHDGMVAAGLARQGPVPGGVDRVELRVRRFGLGGARGSLVAATAASIS